MKYFIGFILLLSFSCGSDEFYGTHCKYNVDFVVKNVCIYANGYNIDNKNLNYALNVVHYKWTEKYGNTEYEIMEKYIKYGSYYQASIELMYPFDNYRGLTSGAYVQLLYGEEELACIANTAIGHEFLHVLGYYFNMNYQHDNSELFLNRESIENCWYDQNCKEARETLENQINIELCNLFCPDSCIWWRTE